VKDTMHTNIAKSFILIIRCLNKGIKFFRSCAPISFKMFDGLKKLRGVWGLCLAIKLESRHRRPGLD